MRDRSRVYIETTIPSFYWSNRSHPAAVKRRAWTRRWWRVFEDEAELVTSSVVIDELRAGAYPTQASALAFMESLRCLDIPAAAANIVDTYVDQMLMPANPSADALHLAIASSHQCQYLLTWNCKHLANANKTGHIHRIHERLGLETPRLVTPLEMMGEEPWSQIPSTTENSKKSRGFAKSAIACPHGLDTI